MKTIENVIQRIFFYGAFILAAMAVFERLALLFRYTLVREIFTPFRFLELAAVALLFSGVLQLNQIRLLLGSKHPESPK